MSASSTRPAAPAWLEAPDDPNDLVPSVWPASARRDENGALEIGGVPAELLRERYGTPLFVLDETEVRAHARRTRAAFEAAAARHGTTARVYYAGKAFLSTELARWVDEEGLRIDVCSAGELSVALAAGLAPGHLGYHGNNKRPAELRRAVDLGVGSIIVDSLDEIERLAAITEGVERPQPVLIRVNTGIHAETHEFLATAHEDQKFGFSPDGARVAATRIRRIPGLELQGLHCHIGSQIFGSAGFAASAERLVALHAELGAGGELPVMNLGGGFGIAYTRADAPAAIEDLADDVVAAVAASCAVHDIPLPELAFEPGRSIVGQAGITLYEVGTVKPVQLGDGLERVYVSVDGGMSDNPRPALYGSAYSARLASRTSGSVPALTRVVGSHCEAGDIVVDAEYLPADVAPGDVLAVPATGAYCFSLSSNYNYAPRPPVVAVRNGRARVIVRGETVDDLLARDVGAASGKGEA